TLQHRRFRRVGQDVAEVWNRTDGADDRPQQPAPGGLDHPKDLPSPAANVFLRCVAVGRKESANRVVADAKQRIGRYGTHDAFSGLADLSELAKLQGILPILSHKADDI